MRIIGSLDAEITVVPEKMCLETIPSLEIYGLRENGTGPG
jgi:hypothetical protein